MDIEDLIKDTCELTTGTFHSGKPMPTKRMDIPMNDPLEMELDTTDPFEAAVYEIVKMNRAKRRDYALDDDPFSNFKATAHALGLQGFGQVESGLFNVLQKIARLQSLRANGRMNNTANESVMDTYLDLAVYSCIVYAMARDESVRASGLQQET